MNLQQLYYFEKIADCRQYTLAAAELHITQAALSTSIIGLEKELDTRLFDRAGKTLTLTPEGAVYLKYVREALLSLQQGREKLSELSASPKNTVIRLGHLESLDHLIPRLLAGHKAAEGIHFEIKHSNAAFLEKELDAGRLDLAFSTAPSLSGLASIQIGVQQNVVVVPKNHPWAGRRSVSLKELDGQHFISYTRETIIRGYYDKILSDAHAHPDIFAESYHHDSILSMVGHGMGIALVPRMDISRLGDTVAVLEPEDSIPPRNMYMLWSSHRPLSSAAAELRDYLKQNTSANNVI